MEAEENGELDWPFSLAWKGLYKVGFLMHELLVRLTSCLCTPPCLYVNLNREDDA